MLPLPSRYSVGVDWVTLTYAPGTRFYDRALWDGRLWVRELCEPFAAGFETKPWRWMGYAGWQHGPVRIGRRADSAILIISGAVVGKPSRLIDLDDARCTRLDIRVDLYYDVHDAEMDRDAESGALAYRAGRAGRPFKVDPRRPNPGGHTLYIGERESPLFVRLYDKQAESGGAPEYQGCWRLEVELKKEAGNETFHNLRSVDFGEDSLTACCLAYCSERGVLFPGWEYGRWDAYAAGAGMVTDVARKLNWLATAVAPAIRFLLRNCDTARIIRVLGLQGVVSVKEDHDGGQDTEWRE